MKMLVLKTRSFAEEAQRQKLSGRALERALKRPLRRPLKATLLGLRDPKIGGSLFKRRVATSTNDGKKQSVTVIVCRAARDRIFCIYACAKDQESILEDFELAALKALSKVFMELNNKQVLDAENKGMLLDGTECEWAQAKSSKKSGSSLIGKTKLESAFKQSAISKAVLAAAKDLYSIGLIDEITMREFGVICKPSIPNYTAEQIKAIRRRCKVSQKEFARYFNVNSSSINQWELGTKRPSNINLQLLKAVDDCGTLDILRL